MGKFVTIYMGLITLCMVLCFFEEVKAMCLDTADCAPNGCCTVANMPYPTPTCNPYRKEGERCKRNHKPFNSTAHTPDGSPWYSATNLYSNLCPCAPGLQCTSGVCTKQ